MLAFEEDGILLRELTEEELIELEEIAVRRVGRNVSVTPKAEGEYDKTGVMLPEAAAKSAVHAMTIVVRFMIHRRKEIVWGTFSSH